MKPQPKQLREVDKDYLAYIRRQPGLITGEQAEAHHPNSRGSGGSDYCAIPLPRPLHTECHSIGKKTFQEKYNIDFDKEIIRLLISYIKEPKRKGALRWQKQQVVAVKK